MMLRSERGLALIVVLLGVAALSLIAFAMLSSGLTATRITRNDWAQLEVQAAADSATQAAILSLFDPLPAEQPPLDGKVRDSAVGDIDITTAIQDEAGRLDINLTSREMLRSYFAAAGGLNVEQADASAARIVAWRTSHGFFDSVDDLYAVGLAPELVARIAPGVTVYSHRASFDMRAASAAVLRAIPGMNQAGAEATMAARKPAIVRPGHAYRIQVVAARGGMRIMRQAVVLITGAAARPYWILDWQSPQETSMTAVLRVARPSDNLDRLLPFYRDGLGLEMLYRFDDHDGFDGIMLGAKGVPYHFEFTRARGHVAGRAPTQDNLLIFYLPERATWQAAVDRMRAAGFAPVAAFNPYWDRDGVTFEDPDGYRLVLQNAAWAL